MALPQNSIRIRDLERLDTPEKITAKQEVLFPGASNGTVKETYSIPINSLAEWLLLNHAANKDLSNLSDSGQSIINHKQDYFYDNPDNTDLNTFIKDGIYKVSIDGSVDCHTPNAITGYFIVSVDTAEDGTVEQQARELHTSPGNVYRRQRVNNIWTNWSMITQDMSNPTFINAPNIVNPGTQDNQAATIGQLNSKFADVFKTELYITEGLIVEGLPEYSNGTLTINSGTKYITNNSIGVSLGTAIVSTIPISGTFYVFIDEAQNIKTFTSFEKVLEFPETPVEGKLYYVIGSDVYKDSTNTYNLAPVGTVTDGSFSQTPSMNLLTVDSLLAAFETVGIDGKVDKEIGTLEENSQITSEFNYERKIMASNNTVDEEGNITNNYGASVTVKTKSGDDETSLQKDVAVEGFAKDGDKSSSFRLTPDGLLISLPRLSGESGVATETDLTEASNAIQEILKTKADKFQDPTGQTTDTWNMLNVWTELNDRILALSGSLAYLQANDFGDPAASENWQQTLTDYAKSEHPEWITIPNSVAVKNLWNNHVWIYSQETALWTDNGLGNVSDATAQLAGIMKLFQSTGTANDGAMSQTATTTAINEGSLKNNNTQRTISLTQESNAVTINLSKDWDVARINIADATETVTINVSAEAYESETLGDYPIARTWDLMVYGKMNQAITLNFTGKSNIHLNPEADFSALGAGTWTVFPVRISGDDLFANNGGSFS